MKLFRGRNRRRKPESRRIELPAIDWRRALQTVAALAVVAGFVLLLRTALDQRVHRVLVDAPFQRVSPVEVEQVVRANLRGGFMTADLGRLQRAVESLAWVDRARIHRVWPDGLRIEVVEQIAAARWAEDGLLNTRGELFMTGTRLVPQELPRLDGPAGSEADVAQRYLTLQGRLVEQGLRIVALRLDARGAWEMDLANGVTVRLGRRQVDERMERFLQVAAPVIAGRAADIAYVDMRYSNGFSIGWREGVPPGGVRPAVEQAPQLQDSDAHA
jgi:cell division protein FtsQ